MNELMFVTGLVGLPIGIGIALGVGWGIALAAVELLVIGGLLSYDAYLKKVKPDA